MSSRSSASRRREKERRRKKKAEKEQNGLAAVDATYQEALGTLAPEASRSVDTNASEN